MMDAAVLYSCTALESHKVAFPLLLDFIHSRGDRLFNEICLITAAVQFNDGISELYLHDVATYLLIK